MGESSTGGNDGAGGVGGGAVVLVELKRREVRGRTRGGPLETDRARGPGLEGLGESRDDNCGRGMLITVLTGGQGNVCLPFSRGMAKT